MQLTGPLELEAEQFLCVMVRDMAMFKGVVGMEPQTETVWRQAVKNKMPQMHFLNKMGLTGAICYFFVDTIVEILGNTPIVLQLPISAEPRETRAQQGHAQGPELYGHAQAQFHAGLHRDGLQEKGDISFSGRRGGLFPESLEG